ncbi:dienelactone hydrolase family protein [Fimbriimonas ginsengisoli]|uniref:Dienelactone hydrolase-related enzyme n=1 Tax=Fimbriimonas ginsengisoli Gsoil 348 TaxID=661478 RepID=A0A068NRQ1_FIMGI|nr:dienelactone hydrolase family protein [Fimbriimonas ginsengisoli]AIE86086.1 Dienelactone hydrolase-related enzyme [Fimbriimonas ginsengisoli Gsoil 348]
MKQILTLILLVTVALASAQDWAKKKLDASPRHQEWVELKNGGRTVKAFVVYPERKDKAPVVILIHEIMGMTDWVQSTADQWAEKGYIAIAPDFLTGMGPNGGRTDSFGDLSKVREAISGLPADQITGDLNAAFDYAKKIPSANGKVAVAGFCWGGGQAFRYTTNQPGLAAAFVFYGVPPTTDAEVARIKAPVYGFYGGNDNRIDATIPDTEKLMKAGGKVYEPVIYEGAGHGFMRAGEQPDAQEANKKARDAAWKRMLEILGKGDLMAALTCCDG